MLQPYVLNETTYGFIKAALRMKKNGIEEGGIKKEKKSYLQENCHKKSKNESSDQPRIAQYLPCDTEGAQTPPSLWLNRAMRSGAQAR